MHRVQKMRPITALFGGRKRGKMAEAGLSTLGITFGYGTETTAGTKPTSFKQLTRINAIGGINIEPEQIDASALEDAITRYVKGRADTGGSFPITVNLTDATKEEWEALITAYKALAGGKRMWFETIIPGFTEAFLLWLSRQSRFHSRRLVRTNF